MSAPDRIIRDFRTVLDLCARGRLVERLDDKMGDVLKALAAHPDDKAKGTLTLTLEFARADERVTVRPKVVIKTPEEKGVGETTLFAAEDGLSLMHPSQMDMFAGPRAVPPKPAANPGA